MAAVSIRNLDETVKERLRVRAARNGRSMEAEMRAILAAAVAPPEATSLFGTILERFGPALGVELELAPRAASRRAAPLRR